LGGEVIHGHLAGHREPQIQRILLGPLVVHSNSLPDTWVSNLESAPPWFSREGVQRERPLAKLQVNRLYVIRLF
ncbi:hypothetical protein, partial [Adlercreutzia sp.]|uniref:hypothetical protein n=1 Tax=Adlercreutzia sp. TaxID=1872387 RepID=UPI003AB10DE7